MKTFWAFMAHAEHVMCTPIVWLFLLLIVMSCSLTNMQLAEVVGTGLAL